MDESAGARCSDCFCGFGRNAKYFPKSAEDVYNVLMNNALGILVLLFIQGLLYVIWQLFSLIPGFALYNGNPGPNPVSNLGFWSAIDFIVLMIGGLSIWFRLNLSGNRSQLELSVSYSRKILLFYFICLMLAIVASIVHLALLIVELVNPTSTLGTTNPAFGWVFVGILVVMIIMDICLSVRVMIYRSNLNYALVLDTTGLLFVLGKDPSDIENKSSSSSPTTIFPSVETAKPINTPILDLVRKKNANSRRK